MIVDTSRVFIIYSHALFAQGVSSLLHREPGLEVVGMDADWREAMKRIGALRPDVVVIDGDTSSVEMLQALGQVLTSIPRTKVISISLASNNASVYRVQQMAIRQTEDLIQAIRTA